MNNNAESNNTVPNSMQPKVNVLVFNVPVVIGVGFLAATLPASANGTIIGM